MGSRRARGAASGPAPGRQSGRMIELQILIAAVFIAVAVFVPQLMSGEGFFKSSLVAIAAVVGVIGALFGLAFVAILPGEIREWYTTPAAVRAARKKNALEALRKIRPDRLDVRATDRFGNTGLHVTCDSYEDDRKRQAVAVIDFLVGHGAGVNAENVHHETPLKLAVKHGYGIEVVNRLLAAGAAADKVLHDAAAGANADTTEVVRALLDAGAPVDAPDALGMTPLHQAARYGTARTIRELLGRGAQINARDRDGRTPLHHALWFPSLSPERTAETIRVLVAAGADRDTADGQGGTPRALAERSGVPALVAAMAGSGPASGAAPA